MATHKLSPAFPLKFPWLTFLEGVYRGRFGPRQHKIPEERKYICLWHMLLAYENQKRHKEKNMRAALGRGNSLNIYGLKISYYLYNIQGEYVFGVHQPPPS